VTLNKNNLKKKTCNRQQQ